MPSPPQAHKVLLAPVQSLTVSHCLSQHFFLQLTLYHSPNGPSAPATHPCLPASYQAREGECRPPGALDGHPQPVPLLSEQLQDLLVAVSKNWKPTFQTHTLWVSGVGDLEAEPAPAPGLPDTSLLPSPSKRTRLGTEPTKSGRPRMSRAAHAPPGRPCLAPSSIGPVRPAPAGSPIPQAAAMSHWIGQGPRGESPDPPGS